MSTPRKPAGPPGGPPRRNPGQHRQLASDGLAPASREARPAAEPPDPETPDSEWPEPDWPGFTPGGRPPSYAFTLAASPWYKERYPDRAANLFDALRAGRNPQPDPEPDRLADWEAGE